MIFMRGKVVKVNTDDIGGKVVKSDDRYVVTDNAFGNSLILSKTELNEGCATTGHKHEGQEEVYFFVGGTGYMQLDEEHITVRDGDIVCIKDGVFHKVYNTGHAPLHFVCVFDGKRYG